MAFFARDKEKRILIEDLSKGASRILLYGRRRFGKSSLIKEVLKSVEGIRIYFTCRPVSLEDNAIAFSSKMLTSLGLPLFSLSSFDKVFEFLSTRDEKITIVFDEYQDLKFREDGNYVDSIFRDGLDSLGDNINFIFSGSSIRMMLDLKNTDNPLFQRFTRELHLREMNYIDSSEFYPNYSVRDKIILYSVFGGIPLLNGALDTTKSVKENIENLFLSETGIAFSYVKNVIETEIKTIPDAYIILSCIGNGKKSYSEIESYLRNEKSRDQLSRTLKRMVENDLLIKHYPINEKGRKHLFYKVANNAIRFYFSYLSDIDEYLNINPSSFFEHKIAPSLNTFISYRFEDIVSEYFGILSDKGIRSDIIRIGTYWYDDKENKKNGEFDVALETSHGYEIYECKFYKNKMKKADVQKEIEKAMAIKSLSVKKFGIVSSSGFEGPIEDLVMISGEELYSLV